MPAPDANRLNDLKRRWAQDPGSRLYLQLADEHRKHGQLEEAESVLVKGLEHRPSDLSGLVALGRCRLELGELDEAIAALETVIARDPAHMVANKLLVEAHLQRGNADKAGERLTTYRLFNDRDPELEHLDYRLRQLRHGASPAAAAVLPEAAEPGPVVSEPVVSEPVVSKPVVFEHRERAATEPTAVEPTVGPAPVAPRAEPVDGGTIPLAASSNGDEIFHLGAVPAAPSLEVLWQEASPARRRGEPFGGLTTGFAALTRGDIFRVEPPLTVVEPLAEEPLAEEPSAEVPPAVVDGEAPTERFEIVEPLVEPPEVVARPRVAEEAVIEEAAEEMADEPSADETPTEKVEIRFPAAEPPTAPGLEEAAAEDRVPEPEAEPIAPTVAAAEAEEGEAATVTLGGLYLQQGHLEEAAKIFEQVLEQDPSNQAARAGLNLARPPQAAPLTALDLLADDSLSGTLPMGLTARKLQVLANYLKHIRNARERDHVH